MPALALRGTACTPCSALSLEQGARCPSRQGKPSAWGPPAGVREGRVAEQAEAGRATLARAGALPRRRPGRWAGDQRRRTATAGRGVLRSASSSGLTCAWETGSAVRILGRVRLGVDVRRRIRRAVSVQYMVPPPTYVRTQHVTSPRGSFSGCVDRGRGLVPWCGRAGHSCHPRVQLIGQQPTRGGGAHLNTVSWRGVVSKYGCQGFGVRSLENFTPSVPATCFP